MIGKQTIGGDFGGALRYIASKEGTRKIGSNLCSDDLIGMANEFREGERLRPRLNRCVFHATLSTDRSEDLSDREWRAIAKEYLYGMGFEGHQWVAFRHLDRTHHHIHIVASRINIANAKVVSDSWNYVRSQQVLREIEKKRAISPVTNSWETQNKAPTTGEWRRAQRTNLPMARVEMRDAIALEMKNAQSFNELKDRLSSKEISVRQRLNEAGEPIGISFAMCDGAVRFAGYHLGKAYTWSAIARHFQENAAKLGDETPTEPPHDEQMAPGFLKELNTDSDSHQSKTILGDFNQKSNAKPSASSSGSIKRGDVETEEYRNAYEGMAKAELGSDWATKGVAFEIDVAVIQRALKKKIPPTVALAILSEGQVARNLGSDWEKKERYLKTVEQVLNGEVLDKDLDNRQYPRR